MLEDAALWQEFAGESEEHLDAIERILSGGGAGARAARDRAAVDTLFRAFHSLKGMSDALGAPGMKTVAHRCEDILGLARAGRLAVGGEVADALLAAVDALRRQRAEVIATHRDVPAPPGLLLRLGAVAEGSAGGGGAEEAPPVAASPQVAEAGMAAGAAPALLGSLASRIQTSAPALVALARTGGTRAGGHQVAAAEARELAEAARLLGLRRLAQTCLALAAAAGTPAALPALGVLRRQLRLLEEASNEPAGAAEIAAEAARTEASVALGPRLAALSLQAEALTAGGNGAAAVAAAAREAAAAAAACGFDALEALLLTLEDMADRAGDPDAAAALAASGPALAERLRAVAEGGVAAMRAPQAPSSDTAGAEAAPDARIPAEFAPVMGAEARRRLLAALEGGRVLYRARLALGAPSEAEAAVAGVLRAEAEVLASRSVLDDAAAGSGLPAHLDMLLAASPDSAVLSRAVTGVDPVRRVVLELAPLEEASGAAGGIGGADAVARGTPVTMRVRQETIDTIIALEAEARAAALALSETLRDGGAAEALSALGALERRLTGGAARELGAALDRLRAVQEALDRAEARLDVGLRRLDDAVMELRVVPIGTLFARLPRVVRAVAQASGKEVEVALEGEDVTIDRSLVELLADPLLHLTRNAVDHGVEAPAEREATGKPRRAVLRVSAARRTGQVRVRVSDDGRGVDRARVLARAAERGLVAPEAAERLTDEEVFALLFRPGFSTAEAVTETSGRGVGLDVVQEAIRRAGGTLEVASRPGEGTSFTLRLPLTAAVQPVLLVEVGGHPYALPAGRVEAVLEGGAAAAGAGPGCDVLDLAAVLGLPQPDRGGGGAVVLVKSGGRAFGLAVDRVQRRTDLLLRPMHPALAALPGMGGVGVLGNGDPVVVLEPDGIAPGGAAMAAGGAQG